MGRADGVAVASLAIDFLATVFVDRAGHPSSYHRVFSRRRWSAWRLARSLAEFILRFWVEGVVY
jgi:hypothetical protein